MWYPPQLLHLRGDPAHQIRLLLRKAIRPDRLAWVEKLADGQLVQGHRSILCRDRHAHTKQGENSESEDRGHQRTMTGPV